MGVASGRDERGVVNKLESGCVEGRGESRWQGMMGQISVSVNDGEVSRVLTNITPSASFGGTATQWQ